MAMMDDAVVELLLVAVPLVTLPSSMDSPALDEVEVFVDSRAALEMDEDSTVLSEESPIEGAIDVGEVEM